MDKTKIVMDAYMASMEGRATELQAVIWELANAINCAQAWIARGDTGDAWDLLREVNYI